MSTENFAALKSEWLQLQDENNSSYYAGKLYGRMWDAGMLELYGLRRKTNATVCLYRVAGRKHRHGDPVDPCVQQGGWMWDRVAMWLDADGQLVVTAEPYSPEEADEDIREVCGKFGLVCEVGSESPYYPGHSTLFIFRRAVAAA